MFAALCNIILQAHRWDNKILNEQKNTAKLTWSWDLSACPSIKGLWSAYISGGQSATTQSIRNAGSYPFAEAAEETVGNSTMWIQMKSPTGNEDRAHMGNRGRWWGEKKCWVTAVLTGALTAELSLGSLTAVFAIFFQSQQELSILYIQGKSYVIHEGEWCTTDTVLIPLFTGVKGAVREGL